MKFVGKYISNIKLALIASAVSGTNVMLISEPGWGKSDLVRLAGETVAPGAGTVWMPLDPSTPPELIKGPYNPAALLNGKLERVVTNTPYDPNAKVVILDEVWRANDVVFDALVHATNRKDIPDQTERAVFWGTANFVGKAERSEALRDRFGMWLHLDPDLDVRGVVDGHLNNGNGFDPAWAQDFPTWEDCLKCRKAHPTPQTLVLIQDYVETLASEAIAQNMKINPRRIVQWSEIIFRTGFWYTQSENWGAIPKQAVIPLRWAYPTTDKVVAQKWAQIADSVTDTLGAAIESIKAQALTKFREVAAIPDVATRTGKVAQLGSFLGQIQADLCRLAGVDTSALSTINDPANPLNKRDPRIRETILEISAWFGRAVQGQKLD